MQTESDLIEQYFAKLSTKPSEAIDGLCQVFYEKLAAVARRRFGNFPLRVSDEYAIANDVLQAFHGRAQQGEFADMREPATLLFTLSRMTKDRVVDEIRRQTALKRGGGKTRGNSIFVPSGGESKNGDFDRFAGVQETPSTKEVATEQMQYLLDKLDDVAMRTILVLRCEGLTNEEIAEQLRVSIATVERKRRRIREILSDDYPAELTTS